MTPPFARLDATNGVLPNAIFRRYFSLKSRISADRKHLRFGQLSRSASLSAIRCAVLNAIQLVVAWGVPAQIFKPVVKWVAIVMATLHSLWAWANKRFKHRFMRVNNANFIVSPQTNKWPALLFVMRVSFNFPRPRITNLAFSRYFVQPLVPDNRTPNFHKFSHSLLMGILP